MQEALPQTATLPRWYALGGRLSQVTVALLTASPWAHFVEVVVAMIQQRPLNELTFFSPSHVSLRGFCILVDIATCIAFCTWWYRAHSNLRFLGVQGLTYSPAGAVWAFFIPLINLVRPQYVGTELWNASSSTARAGERKTWRASSPVVSNWWTCFVLAGFMRGCTVEGEGAPEIVALAGILLLALAARYAIHLIQDVDRDQRRQFREAHVPNAE